MKNAKLSGEFRIANQKFSHTADTSALFIPAITYDQRSNQKMN